MKEKMLGAIEGTYVNLDLVKDIKVYGSSDNKINEYRPFLRFIYSFSLDENGIKQDEEFINGEIYYKTKEEAIERKREIIKKK